MKNVIHASRLGLAVVVALGVAVSAWAQTTGTGAFAKLSPGDQKIARALFEAQSTSSGTTPLTLDQIAGKKKAAHDGWGQVFKQMKEQGLVKDKNLGQVVSSYEHHHPELAAKPDHSKPDKVEKPDKPAKPERPGR
ncbi:MAG: hypothetical protein DMD87_17950 [Candidatus Rokuibacteriota bacterium]|nr:MAG: hypothetical protein DMD87_17950 [Candidatus Rokubacteria bacterium]